MFQGEVVHKRPNNDGNSIDFEFFTTANRKLSQEVNPYVLSLAKSDLSAKKFNQEQFEEISKDVPESEHRDLAHDLSTRGVFRIVWFYSNPQEIIDCCSLKLPEHW